MLNFYLNVIQLVGYKCELWVCLDEKNFDILGGIDERHTRSSYSTAIKFVCLLI